MVERACEVAEKHEGYMVVQTTALCKFPEYCIFFGMLKASVSSKNRFTVDKLPSDLTISGAFAFWLKFYHIFVC